MSGTVPMSTSDSLPSPVSRYHSRWNMSSVSPICILSSTLRMKSSSTSGRRVTAPRGASSRAFRGLAPSAFIWIVAITFSKSSSSSPSSSSSSTSTSAYSYSSSSSSSVTCSR